AFVLLLLGFNYNFLGVTLVSELFCFLFLVFVYPFNDYAFFTRLLLAFFVLFFFFFPSCPHSLFSLLPRPPLYFFFFTFFLKFLGGECGQC
ncbi:hypothetical protein RA269_28185, partial [Pseudomonas syringae pv. tagetis]|uniref:hypothetical protein n=1 Tax=Pseudomonas syringae group genomosp. 7 TaxID=251699 RepID=UPI00377052A4